MTNHDVEQFPVQYFKKMKIIEKKLVKFLDKQDKLKESFIIFHQYLQDQKLFENKHELKSLLYLLVSISNYYQHLQNFFTKCQLIFQSLQEKIKVYFTNFEIFHIFQKSKRLLLYLFKLGIICPTKEIYNFISNNQKFIERKYIEYFYPEFEQYIEENRRNSIHDQITELKESSSIDEFNEKRENGENDLYICKLIQNDSIVDFITYLEKTNISPSFNIQPSIYETDLFLMNKSPTLIEYSAFYGSIQIFKYLYQKDAVLNSSIWSYTIHGGNAEIIHFLEEHKIEPLCNSFQYLIIESIKCHHNEIANYFRNNFCENEQIYLNYLYRKALKYYNYTFFTDEDISSLFNMCKCNQEMNIPYYLCKYDYYIIVEFLLKGLVNVNNTYAIYKPAEKHNKDIVSCIAILNGVVDQESDEDKEIEERNPRYYNILKNERKYSTYEYDLETSTLLHIAIRKGNIDIIEHLLSIQNINVNIILTRTYKEIRDYFEYYIINEERTITHEAILSGYMNIVQYLLKNKSYFSNVPQIIKKVYVDYCSTANDYYEEKYEKTLFHTAIESGYVEIVKLLLSNLNTNVNLESVSKIHEEGGCECYVTSDRIIKKSSLYYAIEKGNIILINLLLEIPNIDINLGIKEEFTNWEGTKTLQEKTPLFLAVEEQNAEIVQHLLKNPMIDLNFVSTYNKYENYERKIYNKTALEFASENKYNDIIHLLLNK